MFVDPCAGEPEVFGELPGVHQIPGRSRAIIGWLGLVLQQLRNALCDPLDRLGRELGGGAAYAAERAVLDGRASCGLRPRSRCHGRRGRVGVLWGWDDGERSHLGLHHVCVVVLVRQDLSCRSECPTAEATGYVKGGHPVFTVRSPRPFRPLHIAAPELLAPLRVAPVDGVTEQVCRRGVLVMRRMSLVVSVPRAVRPWRARPTTTSGRSGRF